MTLKQLWCALSTWHGGGVQVLDGGWLRCKRCGRVFWDEPFHNAGPRPPRPKETP